MMDSRSQIPDPGSQIPDGASRIWSLESGVWNQEARSSAGFSLIELIVVTAIIALSLFFAAARMDWLIPEYQIRGVAREIGAIMKQARSTAQASGQDAYIVYDLQEQRYWLLAAFPEKEEEEEPDPEKPPPQKKNFKYEAVFEREVPDNSSIEIVDVFIGKGDHQDSGEVRVRVPPFGMSEHHIVNLKDDDGREMSVSFNGFTGQTFFDDTYREPGEVREDAE